MFYREVRGRVSYKMSLTESLIEKMAGPWIQNIYKDDEADGYEEMTRPVKLIGHNARRFIWWMSDLLNCSVNGIHNQAVQILERFLASYFRLDDSISVDDLQERRVAVPRKAPVIVAVCVWLAAKMNSASEHQLDASIICIKLRLYANIQSTVRELTTLEMDIYKRINYRIPLWTTVEKANLLASVLGFSGAALKTVESIMNLAEVTRDQVQERVNMIANDTPNEGTSSDPPAPPARPLGNIRNAHYCAAVIISMTRLIDYVGPPTGYVTKLLAKLTRSTPIYLNSISRAINDKLNIFDESPTSGPEPNGRKRKNEDEVVPRKRPRILR